MPMAARMAMNVIRNAYSVATAPELLFVKRRYIDFNWIKVFIYPPVFLVRPVLGLAFYMPPEVVAEGVGVFISTPKLT